MVLGTIHAVGGFDGDRIMKWNGEGQPFGKVWVAGDVLGLAIDLMDKTVSFSVNGDYCEPCGVAFSNIDVPAGWIMPALTSHSGTYRVNFGDRTFIYPPPDESYQSVGTSIGYATTTTTTTTQVMLIRKYSYMKNYTYILINTCIHTCFYFLKPCAHAFE